jgi:hypothetical protein
MAYVRIDTTTKAIKESKGLESKLWESLLTSSFDTDIVYTMIERDKIFELLDWQ